MELKNVIGLGVAGNFAHHLEQAGELKDFENVVTAEQDAPKGIFPFYLPGSDSFLGLYSIGTDKLNLPEYEANAQVEPEIAVLFDIIYNDDNQVTDLVAQKFTTFNDCTIRKEGAKKISEKKSWGINDRFTVTGRTTPHRHPHQGMHGAGGRNCGSAGRGHTRA